MGHHRSDVLAHLFMHASYHRGQIARLVAECGGEVEATDYIRDRLTGINRFEFVLTCIEGTDPQQFWTDTMKQLLGAS